MNRLPKRWQDSARQAFHDALCPIPDPHDYIFCSAVGGQVILAVDVAVDAVLTALLAEVDEESDRRHWDMMVDPKPDMNPAFLAGGLHGLLYARHLILHGERLTSSEADDDQPA